MQTPSVKGSGGVRAFPLCAASLVALGMTLAACAQAGEGMDGTCAECRIALVEEARLESSASAPTSLPISVVATDSGVYALFRDDLEAVSRFDRGGGHVRTYRRPGEGPGELSFPFGLSAGSGGAVVLYDPGSMRRLVFTAALDFVADGPMTLPNSSNAAVELPSGETLVTRRGMVPSVGERIHHLFDGEGIHLRSFGLPFDDEDRRSVFVDESGHIWSMHPDRALIVRYSSEGREVERIDAELPWLDPAPAAPAPRGESPRVAVPPDASVSGLQVDSNGRIWVLGYLPDDDWEMAGPGEYGARYDGAVAVLNREGEVLAALRLDDMVLSWAGRGLLTTYRLTAAGEPVIRLLRVRLEGDVGGPGPSPPAISPA